MGMYTELYLGCELRADTPAALVNDLALICDVPRPPIVGDDDGVMATLAGLEKGEYLTDMGKHIGYPVARSGSYYFDAQPHSLFEYDEISLTYRLTFGADIKNYNQEWETLLNAIEPWLVTYGDWEDGGNAIHIGHYRYEEDETPTLLYLVVVGDKPKIIWHPTDKPVWKNSKVTV